MTTNQTPTVCTIVSKNYWAYARCLADSFLTHHPEGQVFVLLVDEIEGAFDPAQEKFTTILAKDLGIPDFYQMAFRYFVHELNTAVKPFFLEYLFKQYNCQKICYFDPDIQFYQRIDEIFTLLDTYGLVLLPHLTGFLEDGYQPDEVAILRSGVYNLGFIGLVHHAELTTFLHWWQRKLRKYCTGEQGQGLFLDQRWMDLTPSLFSSVCIHRDPGYNVAYWNLNHRLVKAGQSGYMVNGVPLKFYHFSGFNFDDIESVARYQNRYKLADLPELSPLYHVYRDNLIAHEHVRLRELRYLYSHFDNGLFIPEFARYLWRTIEDEQGSGWPNPFVTDQPDSFIHWLNGPADAAGPERVLITRLALELYDRRGDLRQAFPDVLGQDRPAFASWFVQQAREEHQLDSFFTEPIRVSLKNSGQALIPTPPSLVQKRLPLGRSAHAYLSIRNFLNNIGVGQRIRTIIGPEQVFKVRRLFLSGSTPQTAVAQPQAQPSFLAESANVPGQIIVSKPGLNVVGYLRSETGMGEGGRTILRGLYHQGYPVDYTVVQARDGARTSDTTVDTFQEGHSFGINMYYVNADQAAVMYDELGENFFKNKYNIGFWSWELAKFPQFWQDSFHYFDEIWTNTGFVQNAVAQLSPIPVVNVRLPIQVSPPNPAITRQTLGLPEDKFLFLFVFDALSFVERKNPFDLVEAYRRAFAAENYRQTGLVIKVSKLDRFPDHQQALRQAMKSVCGILIDDYLDRDQLNGLFNVCDTYVSLHRSEGFGITLAEAMCLGKPVITTAYSGNIDFTTTYNSYLVPYKLVELNQDYGPYQKGCVWAQPDIDEAAVLMKHVADNPIEAQHKGQLAKQFMAQFYSPESVARGIIKRLEVIRSWR